MIRYRMTVGKGWWNLVLDFIHEVNKYYEFDEANLYMKEKFGGLRLDIRPLLNEVWDIETKYEDKSYTICEECGEPGTYRSDLSWKLTLCDEHYGTEQNRQRL